MTRSEAKQRAMALWGELGIIGRATALLSLLISLWLVVTAAYGAVGTLFVTRPAFERYVQHRDSTLAAYLNQRDREQAVKNERDDVFQYEVRQFMYRDCVRRHGERSCMRPKE